MLLHFGTCWIARQKATPKLLPLNCRVLTKKALFANSSIRFYKLNNFSFHTVPKRTSKKPKCSGAFAFTVSSKEKDTS
jgi:hypothetical protein